MNMIFGSINIVDIVGSAWCSLFKIERIEFFIITNGSTDLWFEIFLETIDKCVIKLRIVIMSSYNYT